MRVDIRDIAALRTVSPTAQKAYVLATGWSKLESFGNHSDRYADDEIPEIMLSPMGLLGDYPCAVSEVIDTFTRIAHTDELTLYCDLVSADLNVMQVWARRHHS